MADYRSWCGSCGEEINFGSHAAGCEYHQKVLDAQKERRDFEAALEDELESRDEESLIEEALELTRVSIACHEAQIAAEKKLSVIERHIFYRGFKVSQEYRERQKNV